ncbi:MAG TPA: hypothetical protein VNM47_09560 [Terriglobia bacterium]|nr:hypothetical protein [Terriglobia bacterium]
MSHNLQEYRRNGLWGEAWSLLSAAALGNLWVKRYGWKYRPPGLGAAVPPDAPTPIRIRDVVSLYDEHLKKNHRESGAKESYSFLSEHSHPNSACLVLYHTYVGAAVHFGDVNPALLPLNAVTACLIDLLMFLGSLLVDSDERTVQADLLAILETIAKLSSQRKD